MKIVTAAQMNHLDRESTRTGTPVSVLMENAGRAVADELRRVLGTVENQHVLCIAGAGNNGGDALVAARYLREWGAEAGIYLCGSRPSDDLNLNLAREKGIACVAAADDQNLVKFNEMLGSSTCVVDGLLGTGRMRPLEGLFKNVLEAVSAAKKERSVFIAAVDLPSGLDADTGAADPACPYADLTVTLAFPKPGLFIFPGAERVGKLVIADIGITESLADDINMELITAEWAGRTLPKRSPDTNKGSYGRVMVVASCASFIGAAYLACGGALRSGAGLVTLAAARSLTPVIASRLAEVTYLPLPENESGAITAESADILERESAPYRVMLLGCGLGQHPDTMQFVGSLIGRKNLPPLIIDADGLNIISRLPEWWKLLPDNTVITPHPGEMSRLCGLTVEQVQADRMGNAVRFAAEWRKVIVLKGAYTIIAAPDGRCRVSPFANPALATAGTGDVLAGVIAGLMAQDLNPYDAASLGVYLHGTAGETARNETGDTGMIASDLLPLLPRAIKQLK